MPNIEKVQYLIRRLQKNMGNKINYYALEHTGEYDNVDMNKSEKYMTILKSYNGVEQCILWEKFQNYFLCKKI